MNGATVALDAIAPLIARWRAARSRAARETVIAEKAERDIVAALGDADTGTIAGQPVVRRHIEERRGFQFSAFETAYPVLAEEFAYRRRLESLKNVNARTTVDAP